jgi:putative tricarboxylic transport membrane protein
MLVILNLPLIGLFVRLLYIPVGILYPLIVAISAIGAYAINGSTVDLWLILGFGVVGYVFGKLDIPVAPLVLSLVLGGIMEQSFRQAMTISGGDLKIFYNSGITVTLLAMSVISVALPFIMPILRRLGSKGDES